MGQVVAAVCADDPGALDDALAAVRVVYDLRPHAVTVEEALADGAPPVDPRRANLRWDTRASRDPDGARRVVEEADVSVKGEWRTQIQTHSCFEPHGVCARLEDDGTATVWASTQSTTSVKGIGRALGVAAGEEVDRPRLFANVS